MINYPISEIRENWNISPKTKKFLSKFAIELTYWISQQLKDSKVEEFINNEHISSSQFTLQNVIVDNNFIEWARLEDARKTFLKKEIWWKSLFTVLNLLEDELVSDAERADQAWYNWVLDKWWNQNYNWWAISPWDNDITTIMM